MKKLPTIDELNAELEQPEKLPTIDELNAQLEQPEKLPTIDELNAQLEQPEKLPTIEELNAEIEQPTKPPTQEQPTAAQENPAAEPEKKPVVGLNEMAGLSYEAQTGVDAPENAVGKHIVNVFGFAGKNLANAQMNAAQTLVDGSERSDDDTNRALSRMLYGDIGGTVASWFSVPDVLEKWDAGEGQRYTDKGERTKARNAFAAGIAKQFIAERTMTQQDAQKELQTREKTFGAETMSDLENTAGYMVPFAMGPVGIAAQFLTGAIGNAEGLANDEYGFDDDGNLIVTAKGDDASTAAAKGIMSSAIETGAEVIGGKLARKVVGGLGKKLAEMTVGKFPIVKEVADKLVATPIGQTVAKAATALNRLKGWASRKLHIDGLGEEYIEEWLDPTLNAVMGSDTRDAEQIPDPGTRVWEAQKDFFTVDNQQRLIASLVILQGAGNFVAYCAERKRMNVVDDYLRKNGLMTDEEISEKSPEEKAQAMNEYVASLSEGKLAEILNQTAEMADGAAASIADEVTKPKEFTPEQNIALDETIPQFVGASEPLVQRVKERIREKLTTGQLGGAQASGVVDQLDDPKQREDLVMQTVEEILHEDNMAEIDKTVNVKTVGFGWQEISGKLDEAMPRTADMVTSGYAGRIAAANPEMAAERVWEIAGYMAVHEGAANQNGQPLTKERIAEVEKQMSEDGAGIVPVEQEDGSFKTVNELEAEAGMGAAIGEAEKDAEGKARENLIEAVEGIAGENGYGILRRGDSEIKFELGKSGKKGMGAMHIVESRMRKDGSTLDEAAEIAVKVGQAAVLGEETLRRYNTIHYDYNGVRAIVAVMPDGTKIITGYEINADAESGANRRPKPLHASPHVSSEEVVAALKRAAQRLGTTPENEGGSTVGIIANSADDVNGDKSLQWEAVPGKDNVWHAPLFPEVKITIQDEDGGKAMLVDGLPDPKTLDDDKRTELGRFLQDLLDKANRNGIQDVDLGEDPSVLDGYGQVLDDYRTKVQDEKFQKRAEGVLGILEKSGLAAGVVTDQETFDQKLAEQGGQQLVADGLTYGWTDGQNVYLNPKFFGTRSGLNTPIHEFGHLAIIATKKINRPLYDKGIELIKKTHYWSEVSGARDYGGDSEEKRAEEALTRMIADRGELLDANTPKSVVDEIKQWLVELWKSFGKSLGIRDLTPEMVEKMSVEDIADAIRAEMSSGREFGTRELSLQEGDLKAKILRFAKYSKPTSRGAKDALEAAKKAWKGLSEEQKVALGQYGDTDVLKTQEARTIANGVRMLREWDARRARISQTVKEQIRRSPNEGQKKIITGSPQYYVSQVTGDVTSPFAFAIDRGLPIPRKGDWGWDAWERLTDGMKHAERRRLEKIIGGEHPKHGGMDTVLSDYAQWLGISWGDGARDFEHGRGIEDFLDDILKERAKFEKWKAGDRKTRDENEADAAAAQERRDGMTDAEFAEEDAWVREAEARRVEAERMGEQDDLSDMPDFKRPISPVAGRENDELSKRFGNWERYANLPKSATSYADVRTILTKEVKKNFTNRSSGLTANLSSNSINKILSGKAVAKSVNLKVHLKAAANIIQLFENGRLFITEDGKKKGVVKSNKIFCPFKSEGETYIAKITVHEYQGQDHRIYSVEAMDVQKAGSILAPKDGSHQADSPTLPSDGGNIAKSDSSGKGGIMLSRGGLSEAGRTPVSEKEFTRLEKEFGTTRYMSEAGYILPNGKLLDLSGRKQGYSGKDHSRHVDHRELTDVIVRTDGNDAMQDVIASGAIRIGPESGVIDLGNLPNARQKDVLWDFIDRFNGEVTVDFRLPNGNNDGGAAYREGTSARRIFQDIEKYFTDGTLPEGTAEEAMFSRGGMARFVAGRARVADDAGHGEQTPGGLAASHELSAQTPTPISQAGRILPMSLPVSEMLQLYKRITGDALPVHVARRMPLGKYSGHTMEGKIIIHSDVFGTVDRTDEEKEKNTLKAHGFFRNEDPRWCMGQSNAAIKAERIRSERQLATQLVNLGDRRVRGIEDGGQAAARGVFAHELAKVVMAMPRTGTGVIGRVQRIGDGVRGEINAMVAASGGNAAGAEALMRGEAGQFLDWAYGGQLVNPATGATVSRGQGQSLKELTDEMFGAFLTMPQQMQGRAQAWYDAILKTIANTPKLADAFRELSVRGVTTQAHSHVLEAIKKSHSLETERRLQQIRSEINEPISAGDLKKELKEKAVTGFHDKLGIVNLRIDWKIKEYKRAQDEIIKQMKAQGAPKSAIAAVQMQIDLFTQGMNDKLNRLELSRTAWERGAANEGMRYVIRMHNLEQKASESWGLSEDDRITYLDMMRVVETQGRAGTRGISGRQASLILGDMARRLGPEKWMRMQQYGREFHAIIEQEFLSNLSVVRMVDQGLLDYMRTQTSYVATKRVQSPEELDAIDQARANAAAAGVNGGDDVISQMYAYMGKNGGSRIGGEGLWNAKLVGSFADKQEVRSATWEKHEILMQIARKNQFIIDMRDALLAAEVKGVRDIPRHIDDVPNGERYGMLPYMENGKKRTLIVPKQISDAFKHEDNKTIRFLMKTNEFFRNLYIDWNLGYAPIDMARNLGSIQKNMEGMHESPFKTALRPVAPGITYLGDVVSTELAAHSKGMAKLAATIPGWKGTTLPFAYEAHKIVNYILHPDEWQRQVSEAEARGDIEEAARLYQTQNKALEVLSANMFVSFRARTTGKATEGFANDFMNRHGLAKIDKINNSTKKSLYRRAVESKWNLIAKNRRRIEYNDMLAKTMAYLHERENYAMKRDVRESGVEVKKSVGLGEVERRGHNTNFIQVTVNQFFNAIEKGIAQHARAIAKRPVGTLTKDGLALGGLFIAGLAKCGVLQKMILSMFGDDEEKIKGSEVEEIYNHLKNYNRAYLNCSAYTRENYNIYPLWNSPDGYTSIVLAMPQDDQEKLFGWLADYCAQTVALENGIPVSRDNFFHAFGKALVKQLAPDVSLTTGFWDIAKLALSLFDENPPEDSFRNAPIIDRDTWNMRFESIPDGANFALAAGKYLLNAGGFRSIYQFPYNGVDNGDGDAPKWIGLSTQRIPLLSPALKRFVKIQVGSPERDAKPIADEMKRMRTVIGHCVKELTRESARHEQGLNSAAPAKYDELLTTWQSRYDLSDRAMREIEKRFLNGWRELEHADDFERKRIMRLIRNGSKLGIEEAQKYMMRGEL